MTSDVRGVQYTGTREMINMTNTVKLTEEESKRLRTFIDGSKWTFAKTMPDCPHFYCVYKGNDDAIWDDYAWFAQLIRDKGYYMMFYDKKMRYLDVDGWRYWTMDEKVEDTDLINRADNKVKTYGDKVPG
jgi:hypothetical protein